MKKFKENDVSILLLNLFFAVFIFVLSFSRVFRMPEFFIFSCFLFGLAESFFIDTKKTLNFIRNSFFRAVIFSSDIGMLFSFYGAESDKILKISVLDSIFRGFLFIFIPAFGLFLSGAIVRLVAKMLSEIIVKK